MRDEAQRSVRDRMPARASRPPKATPGTFGRVGLGNVGRAVAPVRLPSAIERGDRGPLEVGRVMSDLDEAEPGFAGSLNDTPSPPRWARQSLH
ncbi:hypothetical protein GCM10007904_24040 [Oharaeibacter diazotrophicus]|nr:hypothetical protein GCM10007904_24040 [Oharaeibacter diazotrophicus]